MKLTYKDGIFWAQVKFEERLRPKDAGFKWNALAKLWWTESVAKASKFFDVCDEAAQEIITSKTIHTTKAPDKLSWPDKLSPFPFQIKAAEWALSRNKSYLALDPGLGKTICASLIYNSLNHPRLVYICPPFLLLNVETELRKWSTRDVKVVRVTDEENFKTANILLVPDSIIIREEVMARIKEYKGECLIVDEAHRYKDHNAKRTKALFKLEKNFSRVVFMSGTPMPNRPLELWPVINHAAHDVVDFVPFPAYGIRYCAGYKDTFGWNFSGASNVDELFSKLKEKFMLRMTKDQVLKE
jgi:SWI/SNF-related matrix-associated actin-dependent regulator 1 of chromatin subfamily A